MPDLVASDPSLAEAVALLRAARRVAFDTETDAFFAYRPRICLLQLSLFGRDLLIDPLAGLDLAPLGELLEDPEREVVAHAAENDVILLQHQFGWRIANLYDTQVACFVLGLPPYSLSGVLEARFDVRLDKGQQRSDWSRRPLTPKQIAYAADDTHHLLELAADLQAKAAAADRTEEIAWECRRIAARDWEPEPFDPEGFRRLPGAKELRGVDLRVLRELFLFRNREAERRNRAPYRIASDAALLALARPRGGAPPRGVPPSFWRRYGGKVQVVIDRARAAGPLPPRRRPRANSGERMPAGARQRYERLRRWRATAAAARGVETFVVARNELLTRIALAGCRTVGELGAIVEPFRLREYGDAMLAAMLDSPAPRLDNEAPS
ncbi:MAG: HRDC domain-containing protein [Planctomycetota bacterium]